MSAQFTNGNVATGFKVVTIQSNKKRIAFREWLEDVMENLEMSLDDVKFEIDRLERTHHEREVELRKEAAQAEG